MITFLACLAILIGGYFVYGTYVDKITKLDDKNQTPAIKLQDGVDYIPMPWYKVFLIQFLNIAGTGPIFGAIMGALFGPVAFLWITFGTIFAGGVHDFLSGVISMKHNGSSVSEIVGIYLGNGMKQVMRVFSVILLILVGTVFVTSPAGLLTSMTGLDKTIWVVLIIIYYIAATVLPVDKVIGKIYPVFGAALLFMAVGLAGAMLIGQFNGTMTMPEISLENMHPEGLSIFPFLFTTIACGAISGFHATQSPLMARCMKNEKEGRRIFYGSMIAEGVIALVWAAAAMTFFGGTEGLMNAGPAGVVVNTISNSILGKVGGALALLGVVACPITSGDTAFRSARLAIADAINYKQGPVKNRFIIAIPLFAVGIGLCFIDFAIIWRYFAWANQTLATIALWAGAVYLANEGKNHWIATIPGVFMTAVVTTYILIAPEGFRLSETIGYVAGIAGAVIALGLFLKKINKKEAIKV